MSGFTTVSYFLFSSLFSLVTFVLWVRIGLRYFCVSSLHPTSRAIYKLTDPIIKPFQSVLKITNKQSIRYDWACFSALVITEVLKFILIDLFFVNASSVVVFLLIYTLADLIIQPCNLLFYAVLIRVIMSWVNPQWQNPLADLLYLITEPLLRLGRRLIPIYSGFDFSPFIVILILKVITLFIEASMPLPLL